ncbi:MAG: diacylglycerol/lipid kinase family protein [Bacillus sp. (in: firmicutes)]
MKWEKALLIYNGNAGQKGYEQTIGAAVPILSPHIRQLTLMPTQSPNEAERICRELGEEVDVVFILGGDGTVHEAINGLACLEKRPLVGLLPGGTCNDFSRELGLDQNIRTAAEELVRGQIKHVDIGIANDRYFLNFWGIGLIADTSKNINDNQKEAFGKVSYFLSTIKTIQTAESFPYRLEYDGKVLEDEAVLLIVFNGNYLGTVSLPFKGISSNDGLLDIIIVKNSSLAVFKEILFNTRYTHPDGLPEQDVVYLHAKKMNVTTGHEKDVDMDGENYTKTPVDIQVFPDHMRFLCGINDEY